MRLVDLQGRCSFSHKTVVSTNFFFSVCLCCLTLVILYIYVCQNTNSMSFSDENEPILRPSLKRFVLFPISHQDLWDMYKKHLASFWTAEEIDFSQDFAHWNSLSDSEKYYLKHVLAFFAASDGIVNENLSINFSAEIQLAEARAFYSCQELMETVHSETYSLLIDTYVQDPSEKNELFNALQTDKFPAIQNKAQWAFKYMNRDQSLATRIVAFSAVEGIHFSGSFCSIFYFKKRGLLPGLCFSNELISRDEGLHTEFACMIYRNYIQNKLPESEVHDIIKSAVDVEINFVCEAIPVSLIGMNQELMCDYIKFVADYLLTRLGVQKLYNKKNPFEWMDLISMQRKSNFFEARVSEYAKANVMASNNSISDTHTFTTDEDF